MRKSDQIEIRAYQIKNFKILPPLKFCVTVILISGNIRAPVFTLCWSLLTIGIPLIESTGSISFWTKIYPFVGFNEY